MSHPSRDAMHASQEEPMVTSSRPLVPWLNGLTVAVFCLGLLGGCRTDSPAGVAAPGGSEPVGRSRAPIALQGGIEVSRDRREIRVPASVALDEGWLEVVACIPGTREHESIVVSDVTPSVVHAALLLIGAEPGHPGGYDQQRRQPTPPAGSPILVSVAWQDPDTGSRTERSVQELLVTDQEIAPPGFVFAGSLMAPNPPSLGPGEHYVADYVGTIVGLATFGDELVAAQEFHSPEQSVEPQAWRIRSGILPRSGTPVELILRRPIDGIR
ncbi:MAG: YdjY domain-containing protein [Phycisphaerales bacterium]|nr:YdjY domain-containing protein [Phycisphaerales bacterium]